MKIYNETRRQWIYNDEGLYNDYKRCNLSMLEYIKQNKDMIDEVIRNVISGKKPAHYKAYGF